MLINIAYPFGLMLLLNYVIKRSQIRVAKNYIAREMFLGLTKFWHHFLNLYLGMFILEFMVYPGNSIVYKIILPSGYVSAKSCGYIGIHKSSL